MPAGEEPTTLGIEATKDGTVLGRTTVVLQNAQGCDPPVPLLDSAANVLRDGDRVFLDSTAQAGNGQTFRERDSVTYSSRLFAKPAERDREREVVGG